MSSVLAEPSTTTCIGRRSERFLVQVQQDLDVVVLIGGELEVLESYRDIFLADAEEAADADQRGNDLAAPIGHEVIDLADVLVLIVCIGACIFGSCGGELGVPGDWANEGADNVRTRAVAKKRFMALSFVLKCVARIGADSQPSRMTPPEF